MTASQRTVGVIIPTYNRAAMLRETLLALAQQSFPAGQLEVVVVDDGSSDDTAEVARQPYPFPVCYLRQENSGDAEARNYGVRHTTAELLVFLDDDIIVAPDFLARLVADHGGDERRIISGTEVEPQEGLHEQERAALVGAPRQAAALGAEHVAPLNFVDLCSNNMALCRTAYLTIGNMDDLGFSGSSIWCDVDFAYRARKLGYEFVRSPGALYQHRDYVNESLENQIRRSREAAFRAAVLFEKHPDLVSHLPMFEDKVAISWRSDSPTLIARKLMRKLLSSPPLLSLMQRIVAGRHLDSQQPGAATGSTHRLSRALRRWVIGAHIYQGYWSGVRAGVARQGRESG
jgi:glycosyltransferase involved in cell wall biosynthesis